MSGKFCPFIFVDGVRDIRIRSTNLDLLLRDLDGTLARAPTANLRYELEFLLALVGYWCNSIENTST